MNITINKQITLTRIFKKDKADLVRLINHPDIAGNTLTIPHPYYPKDADYFFKLIAQKEEEQGQQFNWAIRNEEGKMIGSIGLGGGDFMGNPYRDLFGYWLGEPFWGKGIMTEVVKKFSAYCLTERKLHRLEASIFLHNSASAKVLEKAGFEREGILKNLYFKNGKFLDAIMYAKTPK